MTARNLQSWIRPFAGVIAASWLLPASGAATFTLPSAPDAQVLHYAQRAAMMAGNYRPFSVTVYADGRVDVHRPEYFKRSGDFRLWLTPAQLEDLVAAAVDNGLVSFDNEAVKREMRQRRLTKLKSADAPPLTTVSDDERTTLEIRLESYVPESSGKLVRDVHRRIHWTNLSHEAESHPRIRSLQGLMQIANRLRELGRTAAKRGIRRASDQSLDTRSVK